MSSLLKGGAIEGVLLPLRRQGDFPLSNGGIDPNRMGKWLFGFGLYMNYDMKHEF